MLPDIVKGSVALARGKTSAGQRIYEMWVPRSPLWPLCVMYQSGSRQLVDHRVDEARIVVDVYGRNHHDAKALTMEIRDIFLPPANVVEGVFGEQIYYDEKGVEKKITFSGARLEDGPRTAQDNDNRILTYYLVQYY